MNTYQLIEQLRRLDPTGLKPVVVPAMEEGFDHIQQIEKVELRSMKRAHATDGRFYHANAQPDRGGPLVYGETFDALLLPEIKVEDMG